MVTYFIVFVLLIALELCYFKIADHFNIIDKPNERSSHSTIVLRGGGIIFAISMVIWSLTPFPSPTGEGSIMLIAAYWPFLLGLLLIAGVSFMDDIHSLPDSLRMVVQIASILLMFWSIGLFGLVLSWWLKALIVIIALFFCVGATNIINFMDGINGITAGYGLAMLLPIALLNRNMGFVAESYLIVAILGLLVFSLFNFRPKGKAKCFAGDVGSIGIAFIILFALGKLMLATQDVTYIVFFLVYGIDGSLTIFHRIMLHENLGQAHRKHAYQLMANELKMSHVTVSLLYMAMQLVVSLGFIYLCPNTVLAHWIYLIGAGIVLAVAYVLFKMKYYHLHEEYLASLETK